MKTLIIPDIHDKTAEAEIIIRKESPDKTRRSLRQPRQ